MNRSNFLETKLQNFLLIPWFTLRWSLCERCISRKLFRRQNIWRWYGITGFQKYQGKGGRCGSCRRTSNTEIIFKHREGAAFASARVWVITSCTFLSTCGVRTNPAGAKRIRETPKTLCNPRWTGKSVVGFAIKLNYNVTVATRQFISFSH